MNYNYTACCWFLATSSNILILPSQFWQIRLESYWLHCSKCRILVPNMSFSVSLHQAFLMVLCIYGGLCGCYGVYIAHTGMMGCVHALTDIHVCTSCNCHVDPVTAIAYQRPTPFCKNFLMWLLWDGFTGRSDRGIKLSFGTVIQRCQPVRFYRI